MKGDKVAKSENIIELEEKLTKRLPRGTKTRILKRDGRKCVLCWSTGFLVIHHYWDDIENPVLPPKKYQSPYYKPRDEELVTLCGRCHWMVHNRPMAPAARLLKEIMAEIYKRTSNKITGGVRNG